MFTKGRAPTISPTATAQAAARAVDKGDLGTVLITSRGKLQGIFTDGDLRRAVLKGLDLAATPVSQVMTKNPKTVRPDALAADALHLMEEKEITALPIVDHAGKVLGIVHLHDLLGRGQISFSPGGGGSVREGDLGGTLLLPQKGAPPNPPS